MSACESKTEIATAPELPMLLCSRCSCVSLVRPAVEDGLYSVPLDHMARTFESSSQHPHTSITQGHV